MLNIRQIPIINDAIRKFANQVIKQMKPKGLYFFRWIMFEISLAMSWEPQGDQCVSSKK